MPRLILIGGAVFGGAVSASAQFTEAELRSATISMIRENRCGFVRIDLTDLRQCPSYSITIIGDGTVTYEGRRGVRTIGVRTHTLSPDEFRQLLDEILQAGFLSLQDRYDSVTHADGTFEIVDHAVATTLAVSVGRTTKGVYNFYGAPGVLRRLERRVDEVADARRYTGRALNQQ